MGGSRDGADLFIFIILASQDLKSWFIARRELSGPPLEGYQLDSSRKFWRLNAWPE